MKKIFNIISALILILYLVGAPMLYAETYFKPDAHGRGVIGGQKGEEWRLGQFSGLVLNGVTYTLPAADGTSGYLLSTNGSGTLSWAAPTATATGIALTGDGDFGDYDIHSVDGLYGVDDQVYIDLGTNAMVSIVSDAGITINGSEFDVSGTTGAITINDDGDAGAITIESTVLDINSLDFVGAGAITAGASSAITINPDSGNAAGEDLIVTAHNVQLTAAGKLTMSPDAAETLAIDLTDTDYTNAISVGDNAILGTTGIINYTNFDVDAAGAVVCTAVDAGSGTIQTTGDITAGGTVTGATIAQDAIVAATADTTLTLDGTGTGGVSIGTVSGTGTITMGGGGFATLVNLPSTVDLVLAGGDLTATDTANADMVTFTNNTMTTADLVTLSATGTRTSNNVITIADGATQATTIQITANAQTSGNGIAYGNSGAGLTGSAIYLAVTDGAGFTGNYIHCYDGTATDFKVARYGATTIAGAAGDMLTVTTGDVQITAGDIDLDAGRIMIDTATETDLSNITMTTNTDVAADAALLTVNDTDTNAGNSHYLLRLRHFADGDAQDLFAVMEDNNGDDKITFGTGGNSTFTMDAGAAITLDSATTTSTVATGVLDLNFKTATDNSEGMNIYANTTGGAGIDVAGLNIDLDDDSSDTGTLIGITINASDATPAGGSTIITGLSLGNALDRSIYTNTEVGGDIIYTDVANAFTGQGWVVDAGPWLGTAGEGFIQFQSDNAATAEAGQVIRINLRGTAADAAGISGKGIYVKDTAGATAGSYLAHFESTNNGAIYAVGDVDISAAPLQGGSPIVLEGATDDAYEVTLAVTDPESDTTLTFPDSPITGGVFPVVLGIGTTQTSQAGAGTADVTGSSIAIPANHAAAGQVYEWWVSGTKTGANAAMIVHLYALDGTILSLTASDAAAVDWVAHITMYVTGGATEEVHGELHCNGKVSVVDVDVTPAKDLATAGGTVKLQIQSQNAGDTVTAEQVSVKFNE